MKLSDQFLNDYRQMTAQGVVFTPEDIVLLNALSVKTQLSPTAARDVHLPRLAFMPRVSPFSVPPVFREPTIAHELWIEGASRWIDTDGERAFYALYAFALSRRAEKLPDADRREKVVKAVFKFAKKRLAKYTKAQLTSAIDYVLFGADWTVGASAPAKSEECREKSVENRKEFSTLHSTLSTLHSPTIGLLTDCRMLRLPISLDDAMRMTSSELTEAINRCWDKIEEKFEPKRAHSRAFGEYVRAREAIRARSRSACKPSQGRDS